MKLLANENIPFASVDILQKAGFDIKAIGNEFAGILDIDVIEFANIEKRTIITFDSDYGELIFKHGYRPNAGVIYLRWSSFSPNDPGEYLIKLFNSQSIQYEGMMTVIGEQNIRQRKFK